MNTTLSSSDRVRAHTNREVQSEIDRQIERQVEYFSTQPSDVISRRISELNREWDIERAIETNASTLAFTGLVLGLTAHRNWFFLTGGVLAFLFQHAVQGWCPPVPVLRRLGFRTRSEIDQEKYALKVLRGDFRALSPQTQTESVNPTEATPDQVLSAVRN